MTVLTLREKLAQAAERASQQQNAPGPRVQTWLTPKRVKLVQDMLNERYPAEEAAARFAAIKWDGMTQRAYQAGIDRLKGVPRIDGKGGPSRPAPAAAAVQVTVPLIEGTFTVSFADGGHKTLRIRRQADDAKFMPGRLLVGHLTGPDNSSDYTNIGHVAPSGQVVIWKKHRGNEKLAEAIRVLVGDPQAAAAAYAEASGNCAKCGRILTAPVEENPFRAMGLGPKCGQDSGW